MNKASIALITIFLIALPDAEAQPQNKALLTRTLRDKVRRLQTQPKNLRSSKSQNKTKNVKYCICNVKFLEKIQKWALRIRKRLKTIYFVQKRAGSCPSKYLAKKKRLLLCLRINVLLLRKVRNKSLKPNAQCKTKNFLQCRPANAKFLRDIWKQALESRRLTEKIYKLRLSRSGPATKKKLSLCFKLGRILALKINKRLH